MRPTDENQHGSTRPNLVSGSRRPAGGEDNILAKLDRDGTRGSAGGTIAGGRRALYALGGMLILGLMATLAWLAHENAIAKRTLPGAASFTETEVVPVAAPTPSPAFPQPMAAAKASAPPASRAALDPAEKVVESAPKEIATRAEATMAPPFVPPLSSREETSKPPAQSTSRPVTRPVIAAARKPPPALAPVAQAEPQPVDSDVALLSAIIMHASGHVGERAQLESQRCTTGKRCPAKE